MNNVPSAMVGDTFALIDHARPAGPPADRTAFDTTLALAAEGAAAEPEVDALDEDDPERGEEPAPNGGAAVVVAPIFFDTLAVADIGSELVLAAEARASSAAEVTVGAPFAGGEGDEVVAEQAVTDDATKPEERMPAPTADAEVLQDAARAPGSSVNARGPSARRVAEGSVHSAPAPAETPPSASVAAGEAPPRTATSDADAQRSATDPRADLPRAAAVSPAHAVSRQASVDGVRMQQTELADAPRPPGGGAGVAPASLRDAVTQSAISGRHPHAPLAARAVSGPAQPASSARASSKRAQPSAEPAFAVNADPAVDGRSIAETAAATVGAPAEGVKPMAVVTVPTPAAISGRSSARDVDGDIRAAEAVGHRRALGGEARGQIDVPELGKVEVRAFANAASVDVHVRAEEGHAKHVILAHGQELSAHVQREVPDARIHLDPLPSQAHSGAGGPSHQGLAGDPRGHRREAADEREASGAREGIAHVSQPSVQRHRARVRIVL